MSANTSPFVPVVSIIVVSYNVRDLLLAALSSIRDQAGPVEVETIVVDNASTDGTVRAVSAAFPEVAVVELLENRGFGAANNVGLRRARGRYILFLNPDAALRPDALPILVRYLDDHPDVGVVAPRLRYPDGSIQPSRRRFPTVATLLVESTVPQRWWSGWPANQRYFLAGTAEEDEQDVDWVVGAAFLARRNALDPIGGFDERFFMYSEELDLCRRIRSRGWRIGYCPNAEVVHHEGRSSEQNLARRAINFNESRARYAEKYAGADVGRALRLYLLANTAYDLGVETAKLLLGHKRRLRLHRVRALAMVAIHQICHLRG